MSDAKAFAPIVANTTISVRWSCTTYYRGPDSPNCEAQNVTCYSCATIATKRYTLTPG